MFEGFEELFYFLELAPGISSSSILLATSYIEYINSTIESKEDLTYFEDESRSHSFQYFRLLEYFPAIKVSLSSVQDLWIANSYRFEAILPVKVSLLSPPLKRVELFLPHSKLHLAFSLGL